MATANLFGDDGKIASKIASLTSGANKLAGGLSSALQSSQDRRAQRDQERQDREAQRAAERTARQSNSDPANATATGTTTPPTSTATTLDGRVSEIVGSNSPLMQQAQTFGLQSANRRGLANSSIAVGSMKGAMLDAAVPIASQEWNDRLQRELQTEKIAADKAMQTSQQSHETSLESSRQANQKQIAEMELAAKEREQIAASITNLQANRYQALANTLNNDKIPAAERAKIQQSINDQYNGAMNTIQNLYGVTVSDQTPGVSATQTGVPASAMSGYQTVTLPGGGTVQVPITAVP